MKRAKLFTWGSSKSRSKRVRSVHRKQVEIPVADIVLKDSRRPLNINRLRSIQKSIEREGLRQAIQVYRLKGVHRGKYGLSAGRHRLAAVEQLGFEKIQANVLPRPDAKLWLSSENLHRANLRALDRSEDIVRYQAAHREIENPDATSSGGNQPSDRGISKLSHLLAIDRKRVADAFRHDRMSAKVKRRLRRHKLDNNRKLLNEVASLQTEQEQLGFIKAKSSSAPTRKASAVVVAELPLPELGRRWQKSSFRVIFEGQNEVMRKLFAKKYLGIDL